MESDLYLYLECIQRPTNRLTQRESLVALAELISTNSELKDVFREKKGLLMLLKLLLTDNEIPIHQAALYALSCAIDSCVSSQNVLLQKGCMGLICRFLKKGPESLLFHPTTCLLSFATQGNSLGQNKARHEGVITILLAFLRDTYPLKKDIVPVWNSILTSLSSIVNNPRNSLNQEMCMEAIPVCLSALNEHQSDSSLVRSLSSFIRLCLSDNAVNQEKFGRIGGLKVCINLLSNTNSRDLASAIISLLNSTPQGLIDSGDLQVAAVPLLLQWMREGGLEDIPAALHTLSILAENSPSAKEALISDRNGMSSIIRCMSIGDEGTKKTARFLLQLLFYSESKRQPNDNTSDIESDLESASYEVVKREKRPNQTRTARSKAHLPNNGASLSSERGGSRKRHVVVKGSGSWAKPTKRARLVVPAKAGSWTGPAETPAPAVRNRPHTPDPTPIVDPRDLETPFLASSRLQTNTPFLTSHKPTNKAPSPNDSRCRAGYSRKRQFDGQHRAPSESENIAEIVSKTVDSKMSEFLEQFQRVMSTAASVSHASTRQGNQAAATSGAPQHNESRNKEGNTKCGPSLQISMAEETPVIEDTDTRCRMEDEDDTQSMVSHVSQVTLLNGFFNVNPDLNPCNRTTPSLRAGLRSLSSAQPASSYRHSGLEPDPPFRDAVIEETDSGFDNVSVASSGFRAAGSWPKINLSQQFYEMDGTPATVRDDELSSHQDATSKKTPFSEQEIANLCKGVQNFGRSWSLILVRFEFDQSRNAGDLRRKFSQIKCYVKENQGNRVTWTDAEVRRLKRGVLRFGSDWNSIMRSYKFEKSKTVSELCNKWLTIAE